MRQILLGESVEQFKRKLKREIVCWVLGGILVVGLNLLLCLLRTDNNHAILLIANILSDIIYGCILLYRIESSILLRKRMLKMWNRSRRTFSAVIKEISNNTHRVPGMDCAEVLAGERVLYLPQTDTIKLEVGIGYTFGLVDNVIVEAEP